MKQVTIRLPDESIEQIEYLKQYYKRMSNDNLDPTTTDIIRRAINYLTQELYE